MRSHISSFARSSGVLLHPSSLPGSPVCGSFGSPSREWLKLLAVNGIGVWQFLPLAPTDSTGSPYSSPSSFAYNPWFLDANDLLEEGFLSSSVINDLPGFKYENQAIVNFELADLRSQKLGTFLRESWESQSESRHLEFDSWKTKQFWLEDHVEFMELRRQNNGLPWWKWNSSFASRNQVKLKAWRSKYKENLLEHRLLQWHLDRQWQSLRKLANEVGVLLLGDLPFYVSRDSSDVWSNRSLFSILSNGSLVSQSGVPPDYFSETGQLWGTPVYRWEKHKRSRYRWWRSRFARHLEQVDLLRLDHFRALESFWSVDGDQMTAENGQWRPSPGLQILRLLKNDCHGKLPLIAEDLGVITSEIEALRDYFELPGMKILQFAFDGNINNPYLPENIIGNKWVVYTGTHDNQTTCSWWSELNEEMKGMVLNRFTNKSKAPCLNLIELGLKTEAMLFIAPLQDILCLDDKSRFNKPGTIGGNWNWRFIGFDQKLTSSIQYYGDLARLNGRDRTILI